MGPTPKSQSHPIGPEVSTHPAQRPRRQTIAGQHITVEPLAPSHSDDLFSAVGGTHHASLWDYMGDGPFLSQQIFHAAITSKSESADPFFFAIIDNATRKAVGYASLMRIDTANRVVEVGNIMFSPLLQRTVAATECMFLMARLAFEDLGYRRYEWKCNDLNAPSKRAALRLGFTYEALFRQHMIVKGRSRDTAWFSMLDSEWEVVKRGFEAWVDPSNFDEQGKQIGDLAALRRSLSAV